MPLKGAVLKNRYPTYGMRELSDYDILIDAGRAEAVKKIMEDDGFAKEQSRCLAHDIYHKQPVLNFEMHTALFDPDKETSQGAKLSRYYRHVEKRLIGDRHGCGCEKHFSPEDFYLYLVAHEFKHYSAGGTGLRSLLDTYIYLKSEKLEQNPVCPEPVLGSGQQKRSGIQSLRRLLSVFLSAQNPAATTALLSDGAGDEKWEIPGRMECTAKSEGEIMMTTVGIQIHTKI